VRLLDNLVVHINDITDIFMFSSLCGFYWW